MHLEDEIELNSELHLAAVIERVWRCICRAEIMLNTEMHLEAVIE